MPSCLGFFVLIDKAVQFLSIPDGEMLLKMKHMLVCFEGVNLSLCAGAGSAQHVRCEWWDGGAAAPGKKLGSPG